MLKVKTSQRLVEIEYNRELAVRYANDWAYDRNPKFANFDEYGGDCTNFISQCVYAGCGVMNFTPTFGWYFINHFNYAPAWSAARYFYKFITENKGVGPYGKVVKKNEVKIGDIVQLRNPKEPVFHHSLIITAIDDKDIYLATHTRDFLGVPLSFYRNAEMRFIHIEGARVFKK